MYQAWPWGGAPAAAPTTAGYVAQTAAVGQAAQWPAAYGQYAAMTPEMQQQWAAAWATQAQYAYAATTATTDATQVAETTTNAQSSEQPKNSSAELEPKDSGELDKLKQLKEQAEQWKTLQQPAAANEWNTNTAAQLDQQLDAEEAEFEKQFSDWEKQFEAWKDQNQGHPDKEAFAQYEKQWQEWRATLLQKKEQMQKAKAERAATAAAAAAPAVDVNAYYQQQQQYMYMQPYMYPQAGGVPPQSGYPQYAGAGEMYPPAAAQQNAPQAQQQENNSMPPPEANNAEGNFEQDQRGGDRFPPQNDFQNYDEYGNMYPPGMEDPYPGRDFGRGRGGRRGRGRGGRWSNDGGDGDRPSLLENPGNDFPPEDYPPDFRGPPFRDDYNAGPGPFDYPPEDDFPPEDGRQRRKFQGRGGNSLLGNTPRDNQGPPPLPSNRYPPDDFDEPPFDDGGPPFPPEEGGFRGGRGPPFRGGRYPPRGGRPPFHPDYDRFGGPPNFPPEGLPFDDRFPYPGDGGPPSRGMRGGMRGPPFGGPRYPDDPHYFRDGPPMRTKDYTHRSADDFDPHYDYENDYEEDVMHYRDNFTAELSVSASNSNVFSQAAVEAFDYDHGLKPMAPLPAIEPPSVKVFNYAHRGPDYDPYRDNFRDRNFKGRNAPPQFSDHDSRDFDFKDSDSRDFRNRESEFKGRDSRDFKDRDSRDFKDRDNRDLKDRDTRDFKDQGTESKGRDFRDRDSRDFRGRDSKDSRDSDFKGRDNVEVEPKGRGRDSELKKDRERDDRRRHREDERPEKRPRWEEERNGSTRDKKESAEPVKSFKEEVALIEDLLVPPKRETRPKQIVVILRGLPGSGKTYVAKLIKDKEVEGGGSAPRILSLDDYFMVETEVNDLDPDTGKKVNRKEFKFEFESEMEETYRSSLFKSFKKTIDDRFFPFIIVDAVHAKTKHYDQYWSYAKQRGFQVYIAEMECKDPVICHKRNTHDRSLEDITQIVKSWEVKPNHFMSLDVRSLLQDVAITEVEMEVETKTEVAEEEDSLSNDAEEEDASVPSKWEKLEATDEKLDQLDGLRVKKVSSSMEDYLQLPDDYDQRDSTPGKKRVRWADLEERKEQDRLRAIGFVVGQTDWNKMTDPSHADRALTRTKFF